ncbi:response regulator [Brevundimonas sp.]|uniref:response regulator n=1 Tax=Brevundimonas sp. TaxID=1871086 RepID=UPI0035B01DE0
MSGVGEALRSSAVVNLSKAVVMVVDDEPFSLALTVQSLSGFGAQTKFACANAAEALNILKDEIVDLMVIDCEMPEVDGYDLVKQLRSAKNEPNSYVPVIMTAGHVKKSKVHKARDCGANFLVTKPFSPATLLERIVWAARDSRPFLQAGDYFGPDRRFRDDGPPSSGERRWNGSSATTSAEPTTGNPS